MVYRACLENRCTCKGTEGSNPSASAIKASPSRTLFFRQIAKGVCGCEDMTMEENQMESAETSSQPTVVYSWRALEFSREQNKPLAWYGLVVLFWIGFVAYSIWTRNWIQTGLAVMLGLVVLLLSPVQPREFEHELTESGFRVGGKSYPYERYKSFAIIKSESGDKLLVVPKQRLGQGLSLQLGGADVERVRAFMINLMPEETREEDLVDRMNRWLKF